MNRIKHRREEMQMSQQGLGRKSGINSTQISHFERGDRNPSVPNLIALADALNCSTDYLLGRTDNPGAIFKGLERIFEVSA